MYIRLTEHINPALHPSQSGFRQGDSTWQMLRIVQSLFECRDKSHYSLLCSFDLSEAFDTVWKWGLLHKFKAFGVAGRCFEWLTSHQ